MTILFAHPIEHTAHSYMFDPTYQVRKRIPVIRRMFEVSCRRVSVAVLQNNAGIVRDNWHQWWNVGSYTLAVIRKGAR